MILSDATISKYIKSKKLVIKPFNKKHIQPSSYDITLAEHFRIFKNIHKPYIDVKTADTEDVTELIKVSNNFLHRLPNVIRSRVFSSLVLEKERGDQQFKIKIAKTFATKELDNKMCWVVKLGLIDKMS